MEETVIAKDQRSLFENNELENKTAADSAVYKEGELRQSFGNLQEQKAAGPEIGTDFTVAEDLHNRRATPKGPIQMQPQSQQLNSQVFGSIRDTRLDSVSSLFNIILINFDDRKKNS